MATLPVVMVVAKCAGVLRLLEAHRSNADNWITEPGLQSTVARMCLAFALLVLARTARVKGSQQTYADATSRP